MDVTHMGFGQLGTRMVKLQQTGITKEACSDLDSWMHPFASYVHHERDCVICVHMHSKCVLQM